MPAVYLRTRLDLLRASQNPDGGWGFRRGKQSWLEPSVYAALALHGEPAADRAWELLKTWQQPDGSWRPAAHVPIGGWGTALCVTLAHVRGELGVPFQRGVQWLLGTSGEETYWLRKALATIGIVDTDRDLQYPAWPWKPGNSAWLEPTAHALVALKKAGRADAANDVLRERVRLGEGQILSTRCADGGWNYGTPEALEIDLPSYPETTGLALLGLQGRPDIGKALDVASRKLTGTASPLARAWISIGLALHGRPLPEPFPVAPSPDLAIAALEALAAPGGNYKLLATEPLHESPQFSSNGRCGRCLGLRRLARRM